MKYNIVITTILISLILSSCSSAGYLSTCGITGEGSAITDQESLSVDYGNIEFVYDIFYISYEHIDWDSQRSVICEIVNKSDSVLFIDEGESYVIRGDGTSNRVYKNFVKTETVGEQKGLIKGKIGIGKSNSTSIQTASERIVSIPPHTRKKMYGHILELDLKAWGYYDGQQVNENNGPKHYVTFSFGSENQQWEHVTNHIFVKEIREGVKNSYFKTNPLRNNQVHFKSFF